MSDGYGSYETLKLERQGNVGWLINNRPQQLNAMNALMREEFASAWIELDRDPQVRVIVHTGEGRAFQTGVDVQEIASDGVGMERYRESAGQFDLHFTSWHQRVAKPVIHMPVASLLSKSVSGRIKLETKLKSPRSARSTISGIRSYVSEYSAV